MARNGAFKKCDCEAFGFKRGSVDKFVEKE
jgi:hypothetical protein